MSQRRCATTTTLVVLPWATRFFEELTKRVAQAHAQPQRFHPVAGELRRANLERFPYHFLSACVTTRSACSLCATIAATPPSVCFATKTQRTPHPPHPLPFPMNTRPTYLFTALLALCAAPQFSPPTPRRSRGLRKPSPRKSVTSICSLSQPATMPPPTKSGPSSSFSTAPANAAPIRGRSRSTARPNSSAVPSRPPRPHPAQKPRRLPRPRRPKPALSANSPPRFSKPTSSSSPPNAPPTRGGTTTACSVSSTTSLPNTAPIPPATISPALAWAVTARGASQ